MQFKTKTKIAQSRYLEIKCGIKLFHLSLHILFLVYILLFNSDILVLYSILKSYSFLRINISNIYSTFGYWPFEPNVLCTYLLSSSSLSICHTIQEMVITNFLEFPWKAKPLNSAVITFCIHSLSPTIVDLKHLITQWENMNTHVVSSASGCS